MQICNGLRRLLIYVIREYANIDVRLPGFDPFIVLPASSFELREHIRRRRSQHCTSDPSNFILIVMISLVEVESIQPDQVKVRGILAAKWAIILLNIGQALLDPIFCSRITQRVNSFRNFNSGFFMHFRHGYSKCSINLIKARGLNRIRHRNRQSIYLIRPSLGLNFVPCGNNTLTDVSFLGKLSKFASGHPTVKQSFEFGVESLEVLLLFSFILSSCLSFIARLHGRNSKRKIQQVCTLTTGYSISSMHVLLNKVSIKYQDLRLVPGPGAASELRFRRVEEEANFRVIV